MRIFLWLVFGLFVLKVVAASPRFSRQVDFDSYDYDERENNVEDNYEYGEAYRYHKNGLQPENEKPDRSDYNYPEPEVVAEEKEEEEEEELPLKPQAVPQGSGGSGVLMGPDTEKEEVELRQATVDTLHVSGDFGGSVGSGETSAASGASGSAVSGDIVASSASGDLSGDIILISGDPEEFFNASGVVSGSGEVLTDGVPEEFVIPSGSGEPLISGDVSGSGAAIGSAFSGASGDSLPEVVTELPSETGVSGDQSGSGFSGDLLSSGASGTSGDSEDSIVSGYSGITLISGDKIPEEVLSATGMPSGDIDGSVDPEVSGTSGLPSVSGSGDVVILVTIRPGQYLRLKTKHPPNLFYVVFVSNVHEEEPFPTTTKSPEEGKTTSVEEGPSGFPLPEEPDEPEVIDAVEPMKHKGKKFCFYSSMPFPSRCFPGLPVCLLCTCLGGSVYCDDLKLNRVPPLPKDTTHFYARYNRITKISKSDFANMNKLKKIDLTANKITSIEDRTFMGLPELEEVIIRENHISQLPALPETMTLIDASHNNIGSKGIHKEAFKDMTSLLYLYLTDNDVDYIPVPLPDSLRSLHLQRNNIQMMHEDTFCNLNDFNYIRNALEDIRLDGNPINLSKTPQAYICLPRIPIGNLI
uniref:Epiphycan n=1 Tax=Poecilia formosa TaxID=48698 RepID=A0A096MB86_POEFO